MEDKPVGGFQAQRPGRRSQARTRGADGLGTSENGSSQYSKRSDCHFQGEDRQRFRNMVLRSAAAALPSGSGRRLVSHVDISTVYAWALRCGARIQ
ncbi:hypothetical protein AHiyo4_13760 [Arthrobacter sp. Hiyo4]|nr:hypothetical protein AHiyo4_13760 [Arthrobacter sp. Hiyo4]